MDHPDLGGYSTQDKIVGMAFGVPMIVHGWSALPLTELIVWPIAAWLAGRNRPDRSWGTRLGTGGLLTALILGSEWGHNLAHAVAARAVGRPMDELRIYFGMPRVVYHQLEDPTVTPRQHIFRALGGPAFNALLLPLIGLLRAFTRPKSVARDAANAALGMNLFLSTLSLLPIPGIDGGPILKWSLVERGSPPAQADETVQKVNLVLGAGLGAAAGVALSRRKWAAGVLMTMLSATALAVGLGWLKEKAG